MERGGGRERGKREKKRKREVTALIRKFQLISIWEFMMIPLHTTTAHEICCGSISNHLAPVVQTLDSAIHRINHYPADSVIGFPNTYPLDSDLSGG